MDLLGLAGVQSEDRLAGEVGRGGTYAGRFDAPGFPVLYAAEDMATCEAEVAHHLTTRYLARERAPRPRDFTYTALEVPLAGRFEDLRDPRRDLKGLQAPTKRAYSVGRQYAYAAYRAGLDGLIYASTRHIGGTCVARFLASGVVIPTAAVGMKVFHWTGRKLVLRG